MAYQDTWRDGAVVARGQRECALRYSVVADQVRRLRTPCSVLDVGAAQGYFSARLADEFGANVLAVDRLRIPQPPTDGRGNVTTMQRDVTEGLLRELGSFDVVLALSVLHHCANWRGILRALRRMTRTLLIVETPHKAEKLRAARWRSELGVIDRAVSALGRSIGTAPGYHQRHLRRTMYAIPGRPLTLRGVVCTGGGNHGVFSARFADRLDTVLGYRMVPGSLNLRLLGVPDAEAVLGPPACEYTDVRMGPHDKEPRGRAYQYWPATIDGTLCHVMRPGSRGHGADAVEIVAPVRLRDSLSLADGAVVEVRVGA